MKLSIIVPIYNAEKYIDKCIESILNQTFSDFELILVNDGSQDASLHICKTWQEKDNRIRIIDKENGGVSSARNAGIDISNGEYIGFVDSDDYIDHHMYEKLFKAVESTNADIGICKRIIPGKAQNYGHEYPERRGFRFSESKQLWKDLFYQGNIETFVTNKIFKLDFIKRSAAYFRCYQLFEDRLYLIQLYNYDPLMIYINEALYFYRPVQNSSVHRYYPQRFDVIKKIYKYELRLNSKFENGYYLNVINRKLAESIVNCIVQEEESNRQNQILMFDTIRNSDEFLIVNSEINAIKLNYKRKRYLRLLFQRKYNILHYQLKIVALCNKAKETVKVILEKISK